MEKRTMVAMDANFKTREDGDDLYIEGYFAVYNSRYQLWDGAYETIAPGAFDGETDGDVRALVNHDSTLVIGRTTAKTLTLSLDEKGLFGRIKVNRDDQDALNVRARINRGDVSQGSFGFDIIEQETQEIGNETVFIIRKVKLYEVSVVTFPAYTDTSVEARRKDLSDIQKRKSDEWKRQASEKLKTIMSH